MRRLMALSFAASLAVGTAAAQTPEPRTFLLIVDDLHIDFRQTPRVRKFLQDLSKSARDEDTWTLVTTGSSAVKSDPKQGATHIRQAISRVTGNALKVREELDAFGDQDHAAVVRRRASLTDIKIGQAISQAADRGALLSIVYLTGGYDARMVPAMSEVVRATADARARLIIVSAFDIAPLLDPIPDVRPDEWAAYIEATRQSLRTLADLTGGSLVFSREEFDAAFARELRP